MKKVLGVVLSLGLLVGLAGCSQAPSATATNPPAAVEPIKMGRVDAAAHGSNAVTIAVVAVQGDKIVGVSLDEYQFMPADKATGLANSEGLAAKNYKDPAQVLASKIVNNDYYSNNMKEKAGSTVAYADNFNAIVEFCEGKTITELEGVLTSTPAEKMPVDTVTGSTLADTAGYVKAIVDAAKAAK
ncbi:hypothetical protein Desdi_2606 [Desulfitobacterium dichloroeliminans LMG P-21439]|uniref:Major membrane immunogen, membrane-anchored lipoprotein n=1 Tax=Desulfitobacterium dichloroeliminans (strain LMG P-21439 / DCA1) TaxID=871963 RepID=L0F9Z9_DESDL|nr:hypothetical protein [Desulfitobacterium dichloroeliminans]AGA70022.1 hypothetical protein Desdi_2606 [Desulfitobacterium dichloroeliminans LMG P-21439]